MDKFDEIDIRLLEVLEEDSRISDKELASMLGISEDEVKKRIKTLKEKKILKKFKAVVDWKKLGKKLVTAIIQVKVVPQERAGFSKICKEIAKDEKVKDVFVVTGEYDLILLVEGEDMDELARFVTEKLAPKREVTGTYTHIVLSEFKRNGVATFDESDKRLKVSF
ncbi:MAG: Lrp/AsnC family transcriptional regulator [Candidatus Altiarchaeales archaeon]|nr:MAG: Lrp/AsnC family transcriptional regulator [Candidatus Altiarchaeales archaeon]